MKKSAILGLNSRTQQYAYKYNTKKGKNTANSKALSYKILTSSGIPTPSLYAKFRNQEKLNEFNWSTLPSSFAVKPSRGLGGEGIIVVKRQAKNEEAWITTSRKKVTVPDLKLHINDILEGAYSMGNFPDVAIIQEYIGRHKTFKRYAYRGTPDIRIIVFNKVPVMAMLRLPTKESGGRANLHQGAIAVGVDISTGITTKAYWHGNFVKYKPSYSVERFGPFGIFRKAKKDVTKRKLNGIKIPNWTIVLTTAVRAQDASGLGYCGVDIVLHPEKGAMVLELNAQPGLQIQMANLAGLKKRLERVEELEVRDADHGVRIAKALFAERFADKVKAEEGIKILSQIEKVAIYSLDGKKKISTDARIDTGAQRSSIDRSLAKELGLLDEKNILWKDRYQYRSASGLETRPVVGIKFILKGKIVKSSVSVANRSKMSSKLLIGRNDMSGFLVNPS